MKYKVPTSVILFPKNGSIYELLIKARLFYQEDQNGY